MLSIPQNYAINENKITWKKCLHNLFPEFELLIDECLTGGTGGAPEFIKLLF